MKSVEERYRTLSEYEGMWSWLHPLLWLLFLEVVREPRGGRTDQGSRTHVYGFSLNRPGMLLNFDNFGRDGK